MRRVEVWEAVCDIGPTRRVRSGRRRRDVDDQRRARAVADEARRARGRSGRETGSLFSRVCRERPTRHARCAGGVRRAGRDARVPPDADRSRGRGMRGRSPRLGTDRDPPRRRRAGGRARESRIGRNPGPPTAAPSRRRRSRFSAPPRGPGASARDAAMSRVLLPRTSLPNATRRV